MKKGVLVALLVVILLAVMSFGIKSFYLYKNPPHRVKNVILMVPDGCSMNVLTLARLYKEHMDPSFKGLAVDSFICGAVRTPTQTGPFGESAANITALVCGKRTKSGLLGLDSSGQPMQNIAERARAAKGRSIAIGIVATCEVAHATPAGMVVHAKRSNYNEVNRQMVAFAPEVVFTGGGKGFLNHEFGDTFPNLTRKDGLNLEDSLKKKGVNLIFGKREFDALDTHKLSKTWALFNSVDRALPEDWDRPDSIPALADMTRKAIALLKHSKDGFILLVEGSQIDWAAHGNNPLGVLSEYLAFDEAVKVAFDFARDKQNRTAVIVCPDHGNGGICIGNAASNPSKKNPDSYSKLSHARFFACLDSATAKKPRMTLSRFHAALTAAFNEKAPLTANRKAVALAVQQSCGFVPTQAETDTLVKRFMLPGKPVWELLGPLFSKYAFIGWTTTGHTGDDVFLAMSHPAGYIKKGVVNNTDITTYIQEILGL